MNVRKNVYPLVSVIIPAYNSEGFIHNTVRSVTKQTYTNLDILIVDDCSTDKTVFAIERLMLHDERIRVIRLSENSGSPGAARNKGIEASRGEFIALLDHDDIWRKDKIRSQLEYLLENDLDLVFSPLWQFRRNNPFIGFLYVRPKIAGQITPKMLLMDNFIQSSSVLIRTRSLRDVGPFKEGSEFRGVDDYEMWLRLVFKHRIGQLNQLLGFYRITDSAISQSQNMINFLDSIKCIHPDLHIPFPQPVYIRFFHKVFGYPKALYNLLFDTTMKRTKHDR